MKNSCSNYVRRVEQALNLPQQQRKKLLRGFQTELKEKLSEAPNPEKLLADMGQPEEVASALLEAVDTKEYIQFNSIRFRHLHLAIASLALIILIAIGTIIYLDASEFKRVEVRITEDSVPTYYFNDTNED